MPKDIQSDKGSNFISGVFWVQVYCFDNQRDWDKGNHLVVVTTREAVQELLHVGYSPFGLVFGYIVRGRMLMSVRKGSKGG